MDILVDVDGTIADCSHRLKWLKTEPKNWDAFLNPNAMVLDPPIAETINILQTLALGDEKIRFIYSSARNERHRDATTTWLDKNCLPHNCSNPYLLEDPKDVYDLYLRADGDFRPDNVVKKEMLRKIRHDGFNPRIVFDDRLEVCKMWAEENIFVFCVNQGIKEF